MRRAFAAIRMRRLSRLRELDRAPRYLSFGEGTPLRNLFDRMTIAVTASKIHLAIGAARIFAQASLDDTHGFDELAPIHPPQEAQTADAVANGYLVGSLLLVSRLHQLLDSQPGLGKHLLDPGQRQCQSEALSLQPAREFRYEWGRHRRVRACHVRDHQHQALRILLRDCRHLLRPRASEIAVDSAGGDAHGNAPQILNQGQPQHNGDGP